MTFFSGIKEQKADQILGLIQSFKIDSRPFKVNLGVGTYRTAAGQPLLLTSVHKAEQLLARKKLDKDYLPIAGDKEFLKQWEKLLLGQESKIILEENIISFQTIGATAALRIAGELISKEITKNIYLSNPTWHNHWRIFSHAEMTPKKYPYYDLKNHQLLFPEICDEIKKMPEKSLILLHAACHNPTGQDLSISQWQELSDLIKNQKLIPFFDVSYQGFDQGVAEDVSMVRYFADEGHEMFVAYSFAKNFGLYAERLGALCIISPNKSVLHNVQTEIETIIRGFYSNPACHGSEVVKLILKDPKLKKEWEDELQDMRFRMSEMRRTFVSMMMAKQSRRDFRYISKQKGMFSLLGLKSEQVDWLKKEKAIYLPPEGRINVAGINIETLDYVTDSIIAAFDHEK